MTTVTMTIISSKLRTRSSSSLQRGGQERRGSPVEEERMAGRGRAETLDQRQGQREVGAQAPPRRVRREGWAPEEEWRREWEEGENSLTS